MAAGRSVRIHEALAAERITGKVQFPEGSPETTLLVHVVADRQPELVEWILEKAGLMYEAGAPLDERLIALQTIHRQTAMLRDGTVQSETIFFDRAEAERQNPSVLPEFRVEH